MSIITDADYVSEIGNTYCLRIFFFPFYTGNEVSLEVKFSRISYLHRKNVYLKTEPPILDI